MCLNVPPLYVLVRPTIKPHRLLTLQIYVYGYNCLVMADNSKASLIRPSFPTAIPSGSTVRPGFTLRLQRSFLIISTTISSTSIPPKADKPITMYLRVFWGTALCSVGTTDEASWVVLLKSPLVAT